MSSLQAKIGKPKSTMAKDRAIGVFDSGIGGLTVLHQIIEALPEESTVYLGDTARSPYGTKSVETVMRYSFENSAFLVEKGVKLVVVACNTSTAIALSRLQESLSVPVIGVIEPGVRRAIKSTKNKKVGVIGTEATIQSGAYTRALKAADPKIEVSRAVRCSCRWSKRVGPTTRCRDDRELSWQSQQAASILGSGLSYPLLKVIEGFSAAACGWSIPPGDRREMAV
jgi:hypothetical protein